MKGCSLRMTDEQLIAKVAMAPGEAVTSPARVLLFGSHARGDATEGSDVDFLVIEQNVPTPYRETVRLRGALHGFPRAVDIVVIDEAQAADPASLAIAVALREGRVVYERTAAAAVRPNAA